MRSPFPGMDPYLERYWGDVRSSLVTFAKVAIQRQLGGNLIARSEDRVYIDDEDALLRQIRIPDVRVVEQGIADIPFQPAAGVAVAEPTVLEVEGDEVTESFVQILDTADGNRVVTVIEFLSPSNKTDKAARESYRAKQEECLEARTSLVEIDLTRAGHRRLLMDMNSIPAERRGEYMVSVWRAYTGKLGRREGYGLPLRQRLPGIRIPLRNGDPDVVLDLQSLVDQAYDAGAYGRALDYRRPLEPPLSPDDAAWADGLLRAAGRRG
jgi:hypothetical protein